MQKIFSPEKLSVTIISLLSFACFYIWMTFHASVVFIQFTNWEIIKVSLAFLILLLIMVALFLPDIYRQKIHLSPVNIIIAGIVLLLLIMFANSPSSQFFNYFRTFPLLEAELGLGWFKDSAFHASIIQSFKNFGFPSTGQHGTPVLGYHVLSHFVDSLIVRITGVDIWKSYGLFYHFKGFLLISSILLFITFVTFRFKAYVFFISLPIFPPVVIGTWHAIGSHGLWFTSILVILTAPILFGILNRKSALSNRNYLFLFILIVLVSLGKISSGFMYGLFVGLFLFFRNFKDYRVYVLGSGWILFFLLYRHFMAPLPLPRNSTTLEILSLSEIARFLLLQVDNIRISTLLHTYILIALLFGLGWLSGNKHTIKTAFAASGAVFLFSIVKNLQPGFSPADIWYFLYGLFSVIVLFCYQTLVRDITSCSDRKDRGVISLGKWYINVFVVILAVVSTSQFPLAGFNLFNISPNNIIKPLQNLNTGNFRYINRHEKLEKSLSFKRLMLGKVHLDPEKFDRPLLELKESLESLLKNKGLEKNQVFLYIPKEIFKNNFHQFEGWKWARGMLVYAVTGIPLVHGLHSLRDDYGHKDYDSNALWVTRKDFDADKACSVGKKDIIIVNELSPPKFTFIECTSTN